jgi:hypothetical protein
MYTLEMKRAFHSITPPPNFEVQLFEHNVEGMFFIEIVADEKKFIKLLDEEKRGAVEYMIRVKDALERNGAIVQITRRAVE